MTLTTYAPFDTQIDRLFNDAVRAFGRDVHSWAPASNAWEDDETFGIELALPAWKSDQVNVQVDKGVLTVEGKREESGEKTEKSSRKYHVREVETASFKRSFRLPTNLQWDKADASFTDGVLTIAFPKREDAKPRQITVR
ncbi:MAG: Hsp20/alpha crystallin family protein [Nitrospirales bacterium]|nr:Hsp20/alpha crystallin family protein [Nitrospira sp.]MDR4500862.1 Hsp20/alpha crystallin family protein [Nitrospirales bacterium]